MGRKPIKSSLLLPDCTVSSLSCLEVGVGGWVSEKDASARKNTFYSNFQDELAAFFSLLREHRNNCSFICAFPLRCI